MPSFNLSRKEHFICDCELINICQLVLYEDELKQVILIHNRLLNIGGKDSKYKIKNLQTLQNLPDFKHFLILPNLNKNLQKNLQKIKNRILRFEHLRKIIYLNNLNRWISNSYNLNNEIFKYLNYKLNTKNSYDYIHSILNKDYGNLNFKEIYSKYSNFRLVINVLEELNNYFYTNVVITTYNGLPYIIQNINFFLPLDTKIDAWQKNSLQQSLQNNSLQNNTLQQNSFSLIEYVKNKYGVIIKDNLQPILKVRDAEFHKELPEMESMESLFNKNTFDKDESRRSLYLLPECCEYCNHLIISIKTLIRFLKDKIFPTIENYLSHLLISISEFEEKINIKFNNILFLKQALTHRSVTTNILLNNERLEFLGDAILDMIVTQFLFENFKNFNEGQLSNYRSLIVRNSYLKKIGKLLQLDKYLLFCVEQKDQLLQSEKILADCLEALIGAIYLDQGLPKCIAFVFHYVIPKQLKLRSAGEIKNLNGGIYHTFEIPFLNEVTLPQHVIKNINELESKIGIEFTNKYLILEALTHKSYQHDIYTIVNDNNNSINGNNNYQQQYERLEFLGDAVLKFITCIYLFINYPLANEFKLTQTKHLLVDNRVSLPLASQNIQLLKHVYYDKVNIKKISDLVSDVFEAVVGAIYLDKLGFYSYSIVITAPSSQVVNNNSEIINLNKDMVNNSNLNNIVDISNNFVINYLIKKRIKTVNPETIQLPYKNQLQHYMQCLLIGGQTLPIYKSIDHSKLDLNYWICHVCIDKELQEEEIEGKFVKKKKSILLAVGEGQDRKEAESDAAKKALELISTIYQDLEMKSSTVGDTISLFESSSNNSNNNSNNNNGLNLNNNITQIDVNQLEILVKQFSIPIYDYLFKAKNRDEFYQQERNKKFENITIDLDNNLEKKKNVE
ncbi:hypothetical protein ABK040_008323 [Willaertia magna]